MRKTRRRSALLDAGHQADEVGTGIALEIARLSVVEKSDAVTDQE
jgi:hypothetical protein